MKITKQALLEAISTAYTNHDGAARRWAEAKVKWQADRKAKWLAERGPQWKELRDLITKTLKKGDVLTTAAVEEVLRKPNSRYGASYLTDYTFTPDVSVPSKLRHPDGEVVYAPVVLPKDIEALKLFLEASPEDTFSMESLSRLGFKAPAWVFRAAAGG